MTNKAEPALEEAGLVRAAAGGDGNALAALYERYEQRVFNLAYRITGSAATAADAVQDAFLDAIRRLPQLGDSEPAFRSYLLAATHNASCELMERRSGKRVAASAATGHEPADAEGNGQLPSEQDEIREASMRLPARQRETLALRELEELSYEEIATIMAINPSSVSQLISRARINLSDELHGTVLASVAAPSPECERALPLIAARDDRQLDPSSRDAAWLDAHLESCDRCRLGVEAMQEAGASYRSWAPIAAAPWLLKETMAKAHAAELADADWGGEPPKTAAMPSPTGSSGGIPAAYQAGPEQGKRSRGRATLAISLAALLLLGGLAAILTANDSPPTKVDSATGKANKPKAAVRKQEPKPTQADKRKGKSAGGEKEAAPAPAPTSEETAPVFTPSESASGGEPSSPPRSSGKTGIQPTQQTQASTPKPSSKPKPAPAPAPPAPTTTTPVVETAPVDESPGNSQGKADPPGKATGRPPK